MSLSPARATRYRGDVVAVCATGTGTAWTPATPFRVQPIGGAELPAVAPWAVANPTCAAWAFEVGTTGGTLLISDGQASATFQLQVVPPP